MTTIYEYYMNILVYEYNSMQRHTEVQIYDSGAAQGMYAADGNGII